jgi:hypothetical protein
MFVDTVFDAPDRAVVEYRDVIRQLEGQFTQIRRGL